MNKYIDAEKLKAEIERLRSEAECERYKAFGNHDCFIISEAKEYICMLLTSFINSLQQEQPVLPGIEGPGIPGKDFIPVEWVARQGEDGLVLFAYASGKAYIKTTYHGNGGDQVIVLIRKKEEKA